MIGYVLGSRFQAVRVRTTDFRDTFLETAADLCEFFFAQGLFKFFDIHPVVCQDLSYFDIAFDAFELIDDRI